MNVYEPNFAGEILLITSCIVPQSSYTRLSDPQKRLFLLESALIHWLEIFDARHITVCDSSNFDWSRFIESDKRYKNIEFLSFQGDRSKVETRGIGFGEGELISFALRMSKRLRSASRMSKVTSRLFVENYNQLRVQGSGDKLICNIGFGGIENFLAGEIMYMDTRFFSVDISFYRRNFLDAYLSVNDSMGLPIESVFARQICSRNLILDVDVFKDYPIIRGVSGSSAHVYNESSFEILVARVRHAVKRLVFVATRMAKAFRKHFEV